MAQIESNLRKREGKPRVREIIRASRGNATQCKAIGTNGRQCGQLVTGKDYCYAHARMAEKVSA